MSLKPCLENDYNFFVHKDIDLQLKRLAFDNRVNELSLNYSEQFFFYNMELNLPKYLTFTRVEISVLYAKKRENLAKRAWTRRCLV